MMLSTTIAIDDVMLPKNIELARAKLKGGFQSLKHEQEMQFKHPVNHLLVMPTVLFDHTYDEFCFAYVVQYLNSHAFKTR